jgi:hypothetical protein
MEKREKRIYLLNMQIEDNFMEIIGLIVLHYQILLILKLEARGKLYSNFPNGKEIV